MLGERSQWYQKFSTSRKRSGREEDPLTKDLGADPAKSTTRKFARNPRGPN